MPELPEVENVIRSLCCNNCSLQGCQIEKVELYWHPSLSSIDPADFTSSLEGMFFDSYRRYGKYIILGLVNSVSGSIRKYMIIHLRMTGKLFMDVGFSRVPGSHTRMIIFLDNGACLRFDDSRKFGKVWLVDEVNSIISGLGPDALTIDPTDFEFRISCYRRQIKPLLLDQSFIAGIGNIYADEILFHAGIHPQSLTSTFSRETIQRLHFSIHAVLTEAVEKNGANINGTFKEGHYIVSVYGREGKPCIKCGSKISKIKVAQRGTHLCNNCQPHQ